MSECEIDGIRYPVAVEKQQVLFNIADTGEALIETFDDWHLGMGAVDHIPGMYYFSTGGDASRFGQIRAPVAFSTTAAHGLDADHHAYYFEGRNPGIGVNYIYKVAGAEIFKFSADLQTLHETFSPGSPATLQAGRPAFWGGSWYVPIGGLDNYVYRLTTINTPPTADVWTIQTWRALSLSTFTAGGTAKIARAFSTNQVALATASPLSAADPGSWATPVSVGDTSTAITDMVENQGLLFVAKEDNLYEFDTDSVARPVLPFGYRVGVDADNGKGMLAFGDIIFYPAIGALWRYKVGAAARPVSLDTIGTYDDFSNSPGVVRLRHRGLTNIGEYLWMVYTDGSTSYPLMARLRRPDDPPGHELVWQAPGSPTGFAGKAVFVTSAHRMIFQTAASGSQQDLFLPMGPDGSPASFTGTRGSGGQFTLGETNFGRPHKRKQVRSVYVDLDSTANLVDIRPALDGAAAASIGTLSASGVVNHTPGTADKCFRYRLAFQITGTGAIIRTLTVEARTPSIYKVVLAADDENLGRFGMTAEDVRTNLMRLVNKGLVSVIGPAGVRDMTLVAAVPTAWQGYVEKMTDTVYETDQGVGHGIEVIISRYTTDGN